MTDVQHPYPAAGVPTSAATASPSEQGGTKEAAAQAASTAADQGKETAATAVEQGKETASAAAQAGSQVASTAAEGARQVASEAAQQVSGVTQQATTQAKDFAQQAQSRLAEQASNQTQRAAGGLRELSQKMRALGEGHPEQAGAAGDAVRQVADKLGELAGRVEQRGFEGTVEDVRELARRRPGMFLMTAAVAGFAVGRLGRGLQAAQQSSSPPSGASPRTPSLPTDGSTGIGTGG